MRAHTVLVLVSCLIPAAAGAQAPASVPPSSERGAEPPDSYTYEAGGRRDPFVSLIGAGTDTKSSVPRQVAEGLAGLTVAEITVRGVIQGPNGPVVMVQGADKKTYLVHPGDKFADGTIKTVTAQGLVIVQDVNDPLSLVKQREIRKQLRSVEGAKP